MRRDIMEVLRRMKKEEIKPNYAELTREFNCDYRVIKRYWKEEITEKKRKVCIWIHLYTSICHTSFKSDFERHVNSHSKIKNQGMAI